MKTICLTIIILTLMYPAMSNCSEDPAYTASSLTVSYLIGYYSDMSDLSKKENLFFHDSDFETKRRFILNNREKITIIVSESGAYRDISKTHYIITRLYEKKNSVSGYSVPHPIAKNNRYFDSITNHTYVKQEDGSYLEYKRNGTFFKKAEAGQPHLAKSRYIHTLDDHSYILYVKQKYHSDEYKILPADEPHPVGWRFLKALNIIGEPYQVSSW